MGIDTASIFHIARTYFGEHQYIDQLEHDGYNWERKHSCLSQRLLAFGWGLNAAGDLPTDKLCDFEKWLTKNI